MTSKTYSPADWNYTFRFHMIAGVAGIRNGLIPAMQVPERKMTGDWVVVHYEEGKGENQCTVVTETRDKLKEKRVIRGREKECETWYYD